MVHEGCWWAWLLVGLAACGGNSSYSPCAGRGGDSDQDDVCQAVDNCPDAPNPAQRDADHDGVGDACDDTPEPCDVHGGDADNDTVCDDFDNCPLTINLNQSDRDFDGRGDVCDPHPDHYDAPDGAGGEGGGSGVEDPVTVVRCAGLGGDDDHDNWCASEDNCPSVYNPSQADVDANGTGDACDEERCDGVDNDGNGVIDDGFSDRDHDGVADCVDQCPGENDVDSDGDKIADCVDPCPGDGSDDDGDGVCSTLDNCPTVYNYDQLDSDGDGVGDACELEVCDGVDNDGDGSIDEGQYIKDQDRDGLCDEIDPCPQDPVNDIDGDGRCGNEDNCSTIANPDQADSNEDGWGDACDFSSGKSCGAAAALGSTPVPPDLGLADVVLDPKHDWLLGTVSSEGKNLPNQFVVIDPSVPAILWSVYVGSNPHRLAVTDDGTRAYVVLDGAASIRVVDLVKRSACLQFPLLSSGDVGAVAALPTNPDVVVVAGGDTVAIDHGVPRPTQISNYNGNSVVVPIDASHMWAWGPSRSSPYRIEVDDVGVHRLLTPQLPAVTLFNGQMVYAGNLLYLDSGQVVDTSAPHLIGTFSRSGPFALDLARHEIFISVGYSTYGVNVYDTSTFTLLRSLQPQLPNDLFYTDKVIRWGDTGLVLNSASEGLLFMTTQAP